MTKKLSQAFFGDKKFTEVKLDLQKKTYLNFKERGELTSEDIRIIFEPYTSKLVEIQSKNSQISLFALYNEFLQGIISQFSEWQFQKLSSIIEISAHVFEHTFQYWLTKEESFKYFSDVIVRHSLFRPPHSVCIFNYEQLTTITNFWINHFHRYFEYYKECMSSNLNEILTCSALPRQSPLQKELKEAKAVDKAEVIKLLH